MHPLKRTAEGEFVRIPVADAVGEIAERVRRLVDEFGPRALALYYGSYFIYNVQNLPFAAAFMQAIGSPMTCNAVTIDQPGKQIAKALHGVWMAPDQSLLAPKVALMVGTNPVVSHQGRIGPPARLLDDFDRWGTQLIVIDPRRTEFAARAALHLQPVPGQDAVVLAGMLRVILAENLQDDRFCRENVDGIDGLRRALDPFTPEFVGGRSGLDPADVVAAARMFGRAGSGYTGAGTGSNMTILMIHVQHAGRAARVPGHGRGARCRPGRGRALDARPRPLAETLDEIAQISGLRGRVEPAALGGDLGRSHDFRKSGQNSSERSTQ